jgi:putative transposase
MVRTPKPFSDGQGGFLPNGASQKAGLNASILDSSWGKLKEIMTYKAEALGKTLLLVNPAWTSQKCSFCGEMVKKSLSTRTHACPTCGYEAHRDHNAALNILALGMESLGIKSLEAPSITPSV